MGTEVLLVVVPSCPAFFGVLSAVTVVTPDRGAYLEIRSLSR